MAPPKENQTNNEQKDDDRNTSSSSWFGSWFERDMRNEIHEQLNAFDERKKQYEEEQEAQRQFFSKHASSSFPFPFFVPPERDNTVNQEHPNSNKHRDSFEDFFGGRFPRPHWQEDSNDGFEDGWHDPGLFGNGNRNHQREQQSMEDLQREMQNMFEAAIAGGMFPPSHGLDGNNQKNRGWTSSSSSTTVMSNSNGASYTMKQDSKNGARLDLKLPKNCDSKNVSLEILRDSPCLIRWRNNDESNNETSRETHRPSQRHRLPQPSQKEQVLELGNSVDCSRLSASISEARRTLTVEAPPKGRLDSSGGGDQEQIYPRSIRVTKKG